MKPIELFSARICPFAHRSRLALREKGIPYELVEIDLRNKPAWYADITPTGAVPALRQGDFLLRESLIINEYVNELAADPPLLPATPQQRAEARLWIDYAATRFILPVYRLLKAQDNSSRSAAREDLLTALTLLDAELHRRRQSGPYWFGRQVSLTDIAFYPWFERWPVLEHYRQQPIPQELAALRDWVEAMQRRAAVRQEAGDVDYYIAQYEGYASGKH